MTMMHDDEDEDAPETPEMVVCAWLRTKMQYITPGGRWGRPSSTAQFWCLSTMTALGPDDGPVRPEQCGPGRGCYEADS